jgi:hypothetical protein
VRSNSEKHSLELVEFPEAVALAILSGGHLTWVGNLLFEQLVLRVCASAVA